MSWIVTNLWLVPALPLLAGGFTAVLPRERKQTAILTVIGAISIALLLALAAFAHTLSAPSAEDSRQVFNLNWFQYGQQWVQIGWILDPLTAVMLVMVCFVGLLIFIYSSAYMAEDENITRFFCFLSLFAGAMLGVLISNSLLLLFMCWEIVGLTSYLLIGFWYERPSAAAAAKKAFLVTRIGDLGLFFGMAWLYTQSGTLLFYNAGQGCMEQPALSTMGTHLPFLGLTVSSAIGLLIFCGAAGKSGQFPLHVWLPDAMEGPTPVSALIHAATMVAAGVFLIARVYPLISFHADALSPITPTAALQVVTWIGAITALFGAMAAVAQWDIKRILAYSTVSQLGYMMIGLGTGGVAVGTFHLITHAFFKALLFLGAGSVIHGCHGEQDIRHMGGLHRSMPITFAAYTSGMLALCGFPIYSGFWSKDEILHAASRWNPTHVPYYIGMLGALLTAFYMTRQMFYVFAGTSRSTGVAPDVDDHTHTAHESPALMTLPLMVLALFAMGLGFIGTAAWPWFESFVNGEPLTFQLSALGGFVPLMLGSSFLVFAGILGGWALYGRRRILKADAPDAIERSQPQIFHTLARAFMVNELYAASIVPFTGFAATVADNLDRWVWGGIVRIVTGLVQGVAQLDDAFDRFGVNAGFDASCGTVSQGGKLLSWWQNGRLQSYLQRLGVAAIVIACLLLWGGRP